jgi:arsenical pump membrane protein
MPRASIGVTYLALRLTQRGAIAEAKIAAKVAKPPLGRRGRLAAYGIGAIAVALLACSALDAALGLPTFICGAVTSAIVLALNRQSPWRVIKGISWGVLPLVAGLFVLVEALVHTGVIAGLSQALHDLLASAVAKTTWGVGILLALACNLMNNLPVGLDRRVCCRRGSFAP